MILQGRNLTQGLTGADVAALHGELAQLGYTVPAAEVQATQFGAGTLAAVEQAQAAAGVAASGVVDAATDEAIASLVRTSTFVVNGRVTSAVSAAVSGLPVRLVDKNVGGDVVAASATTGAGGAYTISTVVGPPTLAARRKPAPDLQTQVISTGANGAVTVLAVSSVAIASSSPLSLDIALPVSTTGLPSEYETLTAALARIYSGRLKDLKENDATQDITYLSARSGWDARAVAMASLADQFSTLTTPAPTPAPAPAAANTAPAPAAAPAAPASLRPEFYYALFRAGAPADAATLFQMRPTTVSAIWTQAGAQNVIPASLSASIPQALQTFQALGAASILAMTPKLGVSTIQDLIAPTLTAAGQPAQFAALLVAHAGDWAGLWAAVGATFGAAMQAKLQLLGQLSYLTLDNAPLLAALDKAEAQTPLAAPIDLATRGYWDPAKWTPLIGASIPAGVPGANAAAQATNYAAWLAAQVRLSFPTATLAQQVKSGAIPLGSTAAVTEAADFLATHQADFVFGVEPVDSYIARNKLTPSNAAVFHLKRLQRVYQMTTTDQATSTLLTNNVDSAYAIMRYDSAGFVRAFADKVGGADAANAIHARARQIHGVTLNVALTYATQRVSSGLGNVSSHMSPAPPSGSGASGQTTAAATLDSLFGSLDTCGCDDCESILSAAAYLVDLLHYIDQPKTVSGANPQTILFGRRPDLQYLPLSCANTNTALPYIDVVNETLEYFVANGLNIDGFQGFDTSDQITSAQLIAAPQNVNDAAYALLQKAFFPAPLPFNRPLALLRGHMGALGVSTPDVMEQLRKNDSLQGATPTSADYGWADILIERLGVSRDEMRIFTDSTLQITDLLGASLASLQTMSVYDLVRRAGIDYDDLVALLETQFINPSAVLIPKLQMLGAPFSTLKALHDNPASVGPLFIAALPADLDYSQYGPTAASGQDIINWVLSDAVYPNAMNLITISNPSSGAIDCTGTLLQLRYANPVPSGSTANVLSGTDWLKFARFLRLWRKVQALLGGDNPTTIQQTDAILAALYPSDKLPATPWDPTKDAANRPLLDAGFQTAILRAGFVFQAIGLLGADPNGSLPSLLACAAPIGVTGSPSFYQSLFASPSLTATDPGAETVTVKGVLFAGDTLRTTINGANVDYLVAAGETTSQAAIAIATTINASAVIDPASGQPVGKRFFAAAQGSQVVVTAGFLVVVPAPAAGVTETLTLASANPTSQTLTVGGAATPGDAVQFSIDGVPVTYTVAAGDTAASIAAALQDVVNASTVADPYCGQALNTIVAASSANNVVTLLAAGAGAPFVLAGSVQSTFNGAYSTWTDTTTSQQGVAVSNTFAPGTVLTTSINGAPLNYVVAAGPTDAAIASALVALINGSTAVDPLTSLAVNALVSAQLLGSDPTKVVLTALNPIVGFALAASANVTSYVAAQAASPFADNGYGVIFADPSQRLLVHEPFLCAACNLTGPEFSQIVEALGFDLTTPLNLANVSALYRNGWLAHALGLSVLEFLRLKQCSGIDPFAALDLGASPDPSAPLIRFIRMAQAMTAAGLDPVQALYLVWNEDDSGALSPQPSDVQGLALTLRKDFAAVEATFARKDDPDGSIAQALMALVYGASDAAFFFGLLSGTYRVSISFANASPVLPQTALAASGGRLAYDDQNKLLTATGYLDATSQGAIKAALAVSTVDSTDNASPGAGVSLTPAAMTNITAAAVLLIGAAANAELVVVQSTTATQFTASLTLAHNGVATPFAIVNDPSLPAAIDALALANQQAVAPFFAQYPELLPLYGAFVASSEATTQRYTDLLANFLPILKSERKQQQALSDISAAIGQDPSFAAALLQDPRFLHASGVSTAAAVIDLTGVEIGGLSAEFFLDGNPSGANPQTADVAGPIQFAQVAVLSGALAAGASVTTTIDGVDIVYALGAADVDFLTLAGNVAAAINASTAVDPKNGAAIGAVVSAAAAGPAVVLTSRSPANPSRAFTLACHSSAAGLIYALTQGPLSAAIASQLPAGVAGVLPAGSGPVGIAVLLQGYVVAPQDGAYSLSVVADAGATATLTLGGVATPLSFGAAAPPNPPVSLSAGALTPIVLTATGVKTTLTLNWQSASGIGWQPIPAAYLFTQGQVDRLRDTYVRFLKAASLASALALDANEIAYLDFDPSRAVATTAKDKIAVGPATVHPAAMANIALGVRLLIDAGAAQETVAVTAVTATSFTATMANAHDGSAAAFAIVSAPSPDIGRGWLNTLPGSPYQDPLSPNYFGGADGARLRATLQAALDFARLKKALSPSDERLLQTLAAPGAILPNGQTALANLTGWQPASLNALLMRFTGATALGPLRGIETFARVYDGLAIVTACRVSAAALLAALTNAPTAAGVASLQSALRAQYAAADWLSVVQPINDPLRIAQRDALVAYILQGFKTHPPAAPYNGVDTADKLFEFFLIDVENQPPVLTSRIRLALSSVQLFIERVLRGIETQTSPGDIDAQQWSWMKRYRVWQANREVFLWPENWLYPELRDDQTDIFQSTLSALLQGDLTDDAASEAYLDYLAALELIAKLEPCGMWYVPASDGSSGGGASDEIAYVVARTAGAHRKHYFRQLQGASWTPWQEVKIDCEDMPLTPIVWDGRLLLFWLRILKGQSSTPAIGQTSNTGPVASWTGPSSKGGGDVSDYANSSATAASGVTIGAVLCWSEFYNGKWQDMKTSDVNRPAMLNYPATAGDRNFELDRNRMRIVLQPTYHQNVPPGALVLALLIPGDGSSPALPVGPGFVLLNTHSLPTNSDDISHLGLDPQALPVPLRLLSPSVQYLGDQNSGTFSLASYNSLQSVFTPHADSTLAILGFPGSPRYVEPQIGPGDGTDWPFFYEDKSNQFYVSIQKSFVPYQVWSGFSAAMAADNTVSQIPYIPTLATTQSAIATVAANSARFSDFATLEGGPQSWSFAGGAHSVVAAFDSGAAFSFQGRIIGPSGGAPSALAGAAAQKVGG